MTMFVGLGTATLLCLLSVQAESVTATMGFIWAGVHVVAILRQWYESAS
jgi:hypothetical protein